MQHRIISFLLLLSAATQVYGQSEAEINAEIEICKTDTLKINTFSLNLDLMFYITHKEMQEYPDLKFVNTAQTHYVLKDTEFGFYFRQILDRLDDGDLYYYHYVSLYSAIFKYKPKPEKNAFLRFLRPQPLFIFQNNSGRGLSERFQAGLFFYPVRHFRPNININFGLGLLRDWSSWEVNNSAKIEKAPFEIKEKILFINSHTQLRDNRYMDFSEWRPTLSLNFSYQMNDAVKLALFSSYQQSLASPFNETIKTAYPEFGKVYPYVYTHLSVEAKVYKGMALKSSFLIDYENNNLAIYDSSWEYRIIFGVTWNFSGKNYLPLIFQKSNKKNI